MWVRFVLWSLADSQTTIGEVFDLEASVSVASGPARLGLALE
ncbi:MAG TPA: hypothetical protein VNC40_09195 [Gaiellaceae bacterium]|nr:hypothetical protein [Gaiellaceae bacterium]